MQHMDTRRVILKNDNIWRELPSENQNDGNVRWICIYDEWGSPQVKALVAVSKIPEREEKVLIYRMHWI